MLLNMMTLMASEELFGRALGPHYIVLDYW
jgi:hypothetical protein